MTPPPLPPAELKLKGNNLTTTWDRGPGQAHESFHVFMKADLAPNGGVGAVHGSGTAYKGKRFTIRNGRVDWSRNVYSFDMHFSDGSPTEHFSMHKDPSKTSWKAELKLKNPREPAAGPQYTSMYATYHASVTLNLET